MLLLCTNTWFYNFVTNFCFWFYLQFSKVNFSHAVWLMFLETSSKLEDLLASIDIPFDCEFLVARQEDDHVINLAEVYHVGTGRAIQTYWFGNWTPNSGLTWPKLGFYQRRNNLQGLVLKTTVRAVRVRFTLKQVWTFYCTKCIKWRHNGSLVRPHVSPPKLLIGFSNKIL
jgi:hypothetical protein